VRYEFRLVERLRGMKCFPGGEVVFGMEISFQIPYKLCYKEIVAFTK